MASIALFCMMAVSNFSWVYLYAAGYAMEEIQTLLIIASIWTAAFISRC